MGLIDRKAPGKSPTLTADQRAALAKIVEAGPEPWRDGVVRWRLIDLGQWLWETFRVSVSARRRWTRVAGARLPQVLGAAAALRQGPGGGGGFQEGLPERVDEVRATHPGQPTELWWQDEARIGQKIRAHPRVGAARDPATGVTTSFRPPRFRNVIAMWTVIVSPSTETVARVTTALLLPATSRTSSAIRLPFSAFRPRTRFCPSNRARQILRSIALVAYGKDYETAAI